MDCQTISFLIRAPLHEINYDKHVSKQETWRFNPLIIWMCNIMMMNNAVLPAVWLRHKISLCHKSTQQVIACSLLAHNQSLALAFFPAVTVSCGGSALQLAVMTLVTHSGTFSAATQWTSQTTCTALKDILKRHYNSNYELKFQLWRYYEGGPKKTGICFCSTGFRC